MKKESKQDIIRKLIREEVSKVLKEEPYDEMDENIIVIDALKKLLNISTTFHSMGVEGKYTNVIEQLVTKMMKDFKISYSQIRQYKDKQN